MHNEQNLKNTPEYRSGMFRIVTCPVCGYPTLDMYWICEHCGWEYDIELQTEDEESPCNGMSLRAYRELYKTGGISMNVTICSRKAAEELLRTDTLSRTAVISVFADYRYYPNQVVYHKIMDALTRYGQEAQPSA